MTVIMLIFVTALFFGSVGTPLVRKLAIKSGFIAMPQADRAHTAPTALMGGIGNLYGRHQRFIIGNNFGRLAVRKYDWACASLPASSPALRLWPRSVYGMIGGPCRPGPNWALKLRQWCLCF